MVVVGAGPAGSVAANYLASKGHSALLLDRQQFPRHKVCGDGLNHDAIRFLKKANLYEEVKSKGHCVKMARSYSTGGFTLEIPGPFITLQRKRLDALLAKRAVMAGVTFCQGTVLGFSGMHGGIREVFVEELGQSLRARFVILSTGAKVGLAKALKLWHHAGPSAVAARCYVQSKDTLDCLVGSYTRPVLPGYGWIFPMGQGLFNMGVVAFYTKGQKKGFSLKSRFNGFIEVFPLARRVMGGGKIISDLEAAPLRCGLPKTVLPGAGNLLAAGETIGSTFNFTGEGIGKAMETGALAARVIHRALCQRDHNIVNTYTKELDVHFRPKYSGYGTAEKWLANPWLNDLMARRGLKSAYLRQGVIDIITHEKDPRTVFSVQGLIKSLWS